MSLLRKIFWLTVIYNCHLVAEHISGESNLIPDLLSRLSDPAMIGNLIPDYMCCYRSTGLARGVGSESGGHASTGVSSYFLEDIVIKMELLHTVLCANWFRPSPGGCATDMSSYCFPVRKIEIC